MNNFVGIVLEAHMSWGHVRLAEISKRKKIATQLKPGQFVLFLNRACSAFKLLGANDMVLHYRHPKGHMLNPKAVQLVPAFLTDSSIGYEEANRKVLADYMKKNLGKEF